MATPRRQKSKAAKRDTRRPVDRRGRSLPRFASESIRRQVGQLWKRVKKHGAVAITRDGEPVAVMLSAEGLLELLVQTPRTRSGRQSRRS